MYTLAGGGASIHGNSEYCLNPGSTLYEKTRNAYSKTNSKHSDIKI